MNRHVRINPAAAVQKPTATLGRFVMVVLLAAVGLWVAGTIGYFAWAFIEGDPLRATQFDRMTITSVASILSPYELRHDEQLPPAYTVDPDGNRLHSWRTLLAEFTDLSGQFAGIDWEKPWDHPDNIKFSGRGTFSDVPYRSQRDIHPTSATHRATILAVTGTGTAFEGSATTRREELPDDLILFVTIRHCGIHWMEPRDIVVAHDAKDRQDGVARSFEPQLDAKLPYYVLFADNDRWLLSADTPSGTLVRLMTIPGAERFDRHKLLSDYVLNRWSEWDDGDY